MNYSESFGTGLKLIGFCFILGFQDSTKNRIRVQTEKIKVFCFAQYLILNILGEKNRNRIIYDYITIRFLFRKLDLDPILFKKLFHSLSLFLISSISIILLFSLSFFMLSILVKTTKITNNKIICSLHSSLSTICISQFFNLPLNFPLSF